MKTWDSAIETKVYLKSKLDVRKSEVTSSKSL